MRCTWRTGLCSFFKLSFLVALSSVSLAGTPGSVDPSFVPPRLTNGVGGVSGIAIQGDGKIVVSGSWSTLTGYPGSEGLVRLNQNGSLDQSFDFARVSVSGGGRDVALQKDGKILVAANGFAFDGMTKGWGIMRINQSGSPDTSFLPTTTGDYVDVIAIQKDDLILVSGNFTRYIKRLNINGSEDLSFDPGSGPNNGTITDIKIQPDGKIIVVGAFDSFNRTTSIMVVRLLSNGTVDSSFSSPFTSGGSWVRSAAIQKDGKILLGGYFVQRNGSPTSYLARLNTNGSFDSSFNASASDYVEHVTLDENERILVSGRFSAVNGTSRDYFARLLWNGSTDVDFVSRNGPSSICNVAIQIGNGDILVGGRFSTAGGLNIGGLVKLYGGPEINPKIPIVEVSTDTDSTKIRFISQQGINYKIQRSDDAITWTNSGDDFFGNGTELLIPIPKDPILKSEFFRLSIRH
jgi:uncharacterized delta-60 repeat protein